MEIRPALPTDAPRLLEMGLMQYQESGWEKRGEACVFDAVSYLEYLEKLDQTGIMLVADTGERVVGMVGADITSLNCNRGVLIFQGVFWYCEPEYRREVGLPLLSAIEKASRERGVQYGVVGVDDGDRSPALSRLYQRAGYRPAEHIHIKRL